MPQTPEVFYPNARLYGYDEIFENLKFEKEMEEYYNISKFRSKDIFDNLKDVPAGVCAMVKPNGSCVIIK